MTSIDAAGPASTQTTTPSLGLLARFRAALARRKVYTSTLKELSSLSDRELSDIGLARHDIRQVAAQAAG